TGRRRWYNVPDTGHDCGSFEPGDPPSRPLPVVLLSAPSAIDRFSKKWIYHDLTAQIVETDPPAADLLARRDDERFRADARRGRRKRLSRHRPVRRQRHHGISGEGF